MYGLRRPVSTMDDAPSLGCCDTFTAGTASAVTRQSDSGKADFSKSGTGVDGRWFCHTCACLSSGSVFLGQGLNLLLPCLALSLKCRAPTAAVSFHVFPAQGIDVQGFQVALAYILVVQLWTAYSSLARGKLANKKDSYKEDFCLIHYTSAFFIFKTKRNSSYYNRPETYLLTYSI